MVEVPEPSSIWEQILSFYHAEPQSPTSIGDIRALLEAGRKYEMQLLTYAMRMQLMQPEYLHQHPLSVYALACAYGLEGVARAAARASLAQPGQLEYVRELELISTRTYHHLLDYRSRCRGAVRATLRWGNNTQPPQWMLAPELRDELKRLPRVALQSCRTCTFPHAGCTACAALVATLSFALSSASEHFRMSCYNKSCRLPRTQRLR